MVFGWLCGLTSVFALLSFWIGKLETRIEVYRNILIDCRATIEQTWLLLKDSEEKRLNAEAEREKWRQRAIYAERLSTENQPETTQ
jgi:hypothetical protein